VGERTVPSHGHKHSKQDHGVVLHCGDADTRVRHESSENKSKIREAALKHCSNTPRRALRRDNAHCTNTHTGLWRGYKQMGVGLGAMDTIVSCKQRDARRGPASFGSFHSRATAKHNVRPMDSGHSIWTCSHGSTHECAQSLSLHLSGIALSLHLSCTALQLQPHSI
jgi:hypothetical protein